MAGNVGNNTTALSNNVNNLVGTLTSMPGGAEALNNAGLGGLAGGGAAAATGAAPAAGAAGAANAAGGAAGQNQQPGPIGTFTTQNGRQVTVNRGANGKLSLTPATGTTEVVNIGGQTKRFAANGFETTAFAQMDAQVFQINLDQRDGIATGLSNLSKVFGARSERVRMLSNALADDANETGIVNPVDLQRMQTESQTTQHLTEIQKKIFDSVSDSIRAWLR